MTVLVLVLIVASAHTIETVLGFGATVVALSLGVHLVPIEVLVVALVLVGWLQSAWLVARGRRLIRWDVLGRRILPLAGIGFPLGIWAAGVLGGGKLKIVLGGLVIALALLEMARGRAGGEGRRELPRTAGVALLGAGGFFHGLLASGGPLIVYYASRVLTDKSSFRATLSVLWLMLNTVLIGAYGLGGRLEGQALATAAVCLPALGCGIVAGEVLHPRVDEAAFRRFVQVVLLLIGAALLV